MRNPQRKYISKELFRLFKVSRSHSSIPLCEQRSREMLQGWLRKMLQEVVAAVRDENPDLLFHALCPLGITGLIGLAFDVDSVIRLCWLDEKAAAGDKAARDMIRAIADALVC